LGELADMAEGLELVEFDPKQPFSLIGFRG
jgi:hypothetical protein